MRRFRSLDFVILRNLKAILSKFEWKCPTAERCESSWPGYPNTNPSIGFSTSAIIGLPRSRSSTCCRMIPDPGVQRTVIEGPPADARTDGNNRLGSSLAIEELPAGLVSCLLDRWTGHVAIGTEHAAVPLFGAQGHTAACTLIRGLPRVRGHHLNGCEPAGRAC
jgi:hypothetical protein